MGGGVPLEPAPTLPEESGPTRPPSFRSASRGGPLGRASPPGPFPPRSRTLSMSEGKGGPVPWYGVGTETGRASRTGREVGLLSCRRYPINTS